MLKLLIAAGIFLLLLGGVQASDGVAPGILEGHLTIASAKPVELAEAGSSKYAGLNYAEYPCVILNHETLKEILSVTADKDGNYRVALPPGDYVLDAKGRAPGHVRATPQRFTIVSNQTVHIDFNLDTGIR